MYVQYIEELTLCAKPYRLTWTFYDRDLLFIMEPSSFIIIRKNPSNMVSYVVQW